MIGTSFNQYRITASIGAGEVGEVFRARDTRLNRDVAIKVLPEDFKTRHEQRVKSDRAGKKCSPAPGSRSRVPSWI